MTETWREFAACRDADPELFFLPDGARERSPSSLRRTAAAKTVCRGCPVVAECLAVALDTGERGVWGGTTEDERRAMRRASA